MPISATYFGDVEDVLVGTWDVRSASFMELIVMTSRPLWDVLRSLLLSDTTAIFLSHLPL